MLRSLAGAVLAAWVAAFVLCTVHCSGISFGSEHDDAAQPSCHDSGSAKSAHHDDGDSNDADGCPATGLSCSVFQSAWFDGKAATLAQLPFHVLYLLVPMALAFDATPAESSKIVFRPPEARDWVFTPEVCLGPAFRSLAPPILA